MKKFIPHCLTAMKTTALLMLLMVFLLNSNTIKAQYTDECFVDSTMFPPLDSTARLTAYSPNGSDFTPHGEMKVLIIYAGFTNDRETNPDTSLVWPYVDPAGILPNGKTFPKNTGDLFYDDYSDFSPSNTDKSISNFYYQMSLPSGNPLKMIASVFPERINVFVDSADCSDYYVWNNLATRVFDSIQAKYPGYDFSAFDNRKNWPSYQTDNSSSNHDDQIDYVVLIWRYSQNWSKDPAGDSTLFNKWLSGGSVADIAGGYQFTDALGNPTFAVNAGFRTQKGFWGISKTTFTHEVAHTNYWAPHCNNANNAVGSYFYGNYGWGMMKSVGSPNVYDCANGWERWYTGWIELTANNNTVSSDIKSVSDLQNGGVYTLHDFITTGDVIRVRLPHDTTQFLWLENHAGKNIFDHRKDYETDALGTPLPIAPRGLVAYIEGTRYSRNYTAPTGTGVNTIKYLNALGNHDFTNQYANPEPRIPEYWDIAYDFQKGLSNPLGCHNQLTKIRNDFYGATDSIVYISYTNGDNRNEHRDFVKQNGVLTFGDLGFGMNFPQGAKVDLGSNPVITNLQIYNTTTKKLAPIHLNGISFEVLSYNADSSITVKIRLDDYDVRNNTRYTGEIELYPNIVSSANYSLNIIGGQYLDIDKSGTPNRHRLTTQGDFINPTKLTCLNGSYVHLEQESMINVINGSTLHLLTGSKLEVEFDATLHIGANSTLIVEDGAEINLKPGSYLVIDDGATVIYKNKTANKGFLVGSTSYTGIPAKVFVSGNITFDATAKWEHYRDGFYKFHPTHSLTIPNAVPVKFTGKGKTRKFVELANNTTLTLSNVDDVDWNSGLVQYGSNSKIVLDDVNFTSINATYNPSSNPQTTATAFEINNPLPTFFNSCDFNNLGKGVKVTNASSLVHIQTGKFTTMSTYGVEVSDAANFKMTNGFVNGAQTALYVQNSNVVEIYSTEFKNATYGVNLEYVSGAYFSGANIQSNTTGLKALASLVFLRNGARIHQSSNYGVEIYGNYDAGLGSYNAMLTMGDIGCGAVYNNTNVGIFGIDALLNIDAVQHSIDRGDNIIKPNRFDNNGGFTFEFCYGSSTVAPSQINAKGNFWGVNPADIQSNEYVFVANACTSWGGTPVYLPLIHTDYSTCVPNNTCMECSIGGGGGSSSSMMSSSSSTPANLAVQTSFKEANVLFVEEDNAATRNEFTDVSAVSLIKDTLTDTWQGRSVNDVLFNLNKETVHLVQVSKAIKAKANNSNLRTIQVVDDIFKNIQPEHVGTTLTVALYPNPTNDKLFVDLENEGNYLLVIYNISGQKVIEQLLTDKHNLVQVNQLPDGLYIYELSAPNSNIVKGNITITK
ncbi:MAG: T9SS type A sorting domain-containing protein [Flavobacteriales bacterium]|nr:T9SS type A sorting domain-containing protein [Flavobacteriales bacterium]